MDQLITLFGGGGFLGRYVTQALIQRGARVRVAGRDPSRAWFLKPLGGLGQTQFVRADVTRADSARAAAEGSDGVVNLVGILKGDFERVHGDGARHAAAAARAAGARSFVQISAIGADAAAPSAYARSKALGERAATEDFPGAVVIRPSVVFGPEDQFVNRFARMAEIAPVLPVIRGGTRFQPVWVADVANAIATAALDPVHAGHTYELGGPEVLTMRALMDWIAQATGRRRTLVDVPDMVAAGLARLGAWLPGAPLTWDQWLLLQRDNVVSEGAAGFAAFGIAPRPLAAVAPSWLVRYRRGGRFGLAGAGA